jgi:hypothetical protein
MSNFEILKNSNIYDDMTKEKQDALKDILALFDVYDGSYKSRTAMLNIIADTYERFETVLDEFRLCVRLLEYTLSTSMFIEDAIALAKIVYNSNK